MNTSVPVSRSDAEALSDEEVVRLVRAGDRPLFEILMRRYNQRLYRVARAVLRDDAEAEDVIQQAYVNAFTHLDQFAERARFSTWLTRIALYEAFARRRRRGRFVEMDAMHDAEDGRAAKKEAGPDPERQAYAGELRQALEAALEAIPEMYRSVFVLRELEGLSTAESAECLEVSADVVKTRLLRARSLLREALYEKAGVGERDLYPFPATRCNRVVAAVLSRIGVTAPS
jgi:RNA polymerase sigma-70 factor (ECF subfamily)